MRTTAVAATTEWKQQAQEIAADGGLTGMFLGSVSHGAVHHAHCSVAVVR